MKKETNQLAKLLNDFISTDGYHRTPVPGVACTKYSKVEKPTKRRWHASFAIVAQGCKVVALEKQTFRAGAYCYTVTSVDLPVVSRIAGASEPKPFLGLLLDFDSPLLSEIDALMKQDLPIENHDFKNSILTGVADEKILEAATRLVQLFTRPEDAAVLGPLIVKEMFYHLLRGKNGPAIRQLVRSGGSMQLISKAIRKLETNICDEINIHELIKISNMSRSAFFKRFKQVTSLSPIQYQKRLRLLEARRLMMSEAQTAEGAAFKVGYTSPSQFSREYSRMFGAPPRQDTEKRTKALAESN